MSALTFKKTLSILLSLCILSGITVTSAKTNNAPGFEYTNNEIFVMYKDGDSTSVINEPIDDTRQGTKLFDFVLENDEYKALYHEYYEKLVNEYFYGGEFEKTYNRIRSQIDSLAESDPNSMYSYEEYLKGTEVLYDTVMLRAESIKGQLSGSIPSTSDGQKENSSSLVNASHINLSDLGQFNMGDSFSGRNRQMPGNNTDTQKSN